MNKPDPTLDEFKAMWSLRGLDPDDFDMQSLYLAWCSLHRLMQRMQPSNVLPQSVFVASSLLERDEF